MPDWETLGEPVLVLSVPIESVQTFFLRLPRTVC